MNKTFKRYISFAVLLIGICIIGILALIPGEQSVLAFIAGAITGIGLVNLVASLL